MVCNVILFAYSYLLFWLLYLFLECADLSECRHATSWTSLLQRHQAYRWRCYIFTGLRSATFRIPQIRCTLRCKGGGFLGTSRIRWDFSNFFLLLISRICFVLLRKWIWTIRKIINVPFISMQFQIMFKQLLIVQGWQKTSDSTWYFFCC